jgi:hypothetical protein
MNQRDVLSVAEFVQQLQSLMDSLMGHLWSRLEDFSSLIYLFSSLFRQSF